LEEENKNEKQTYRFICTLLITTCVVPVMGEFIAQSTDPTKDAITDTARTSKKDALWHDSVK
jgi:hypothetical protein